jgi:hypothetical protein
MISKDKITILYTYWNTPEELWRKSLLSACKLNLNITIVNDQSSKEYLDLLNKTVAEAKKEHPSINIDIITPPEKLQQEGATFYGAERITTPYTIRMDSDDIIFCIPEVNNFREDFDIYNAGIKRIVNIRDWLVGKNTNVNGSVVKTSILRFMYEDYQFMKEYHNYWHEDAFASIRLLLLKPEVKIKKADKQCYRQILTSEHKIKPRINKRIKRLETLLAASIRYKQSEEDYYKRSSFLWKNLK